MGAKVEVGFRGWCARGAEGVAGVGKETIPRRGIETGRGIVTPNRKMMKSYGRVFLRALSLCVGASIDRRGVPPLAVVGVGLGFGDDAAEEL